MEWDENLVNKYFIRKYDSINPHAYDFKPDHDGFKNMHDIDLASKHFFSLCAEESWTRERLINRLNSISNGEFSGVPKSVHTPEKYLSTLKSSAELVLKALENGTFMNTVKSGNHFR